MCSCSNGCDTPRPAKIFQGSLVEIWLLILEGDPCCRRLQSERPLARLRANLPIGISDSWRTRPKITTFGGGTPDLA